MDAQQNVGFALHGLGHHIHGDAVVRQDLGQVISGGLVDAGLIDHMDPVPQGKRGAVVGDLLDHRVDVVGPLCIRLSGVYKLHI